MGLMGNCSSLQQPTRVPAGHSHQALLPILYLRSVVHPRLLAPSITFIRVTGVRAVAGGEWGGLGGGLTHSLPQGSLLKVVLEDYLRLKKLFAQRMVQKASSCHSSISEVAGPARNCVLCPSAGGAHFFSPSLSPPSHAHPYQSLCGVQQPGQDSNGWGPGSLLSGFLSGLSQGGCWGVFLRLTEPQKMP